MGALPTATTAPPRRSRQRSTAAAERVVASAAARSRVSGAFKVTTTSVPGRRARITPAATISQSQITGAPEAMAAAPASAAPGEKASRSATSGMPQAWTTRAASPAMAGGETIEPGLAPHGLEALDVDRPRIP